MKIYTRIVMDMTTMQVEEAESFEYQGEVAECKGGGGGDQVDEEYNRRIANIAESQQGMAEEMLNMYKYGETNAPTTQYKVGDEWMAEDKAQKAVPKDIDQLQKRHVEDWETKHLGEGQTKRELKGMKEQYFIPDGTGEGHWGDAEEARKYIEGNPDLSDYESRRVGPEEGVYGSQLGLEQAQIKANMGLIPHQTDLAESQIGAQQAEVGATLDSGIWGEGQQKDPDTAYLEGVASHANEQGWEHGGILPGQWNAERMRQAMDDLGLSIQDHKRKYGDNPRLREHVRRASGGDANRFTEVAKAERDKLGLQRDEIAAQQRILPKQTDLTLDEIAAQRKGLGLQSDYYSAMDKANLPQQSVEAQSGFLKDARDGVDVRGRMGQAQADVTAGYQGAADQQRLAQSRMGLRPSSGASQARLQQIQRKQASDIAGARTQARRQAEDENFRRRQAAAQFGLQGLNRG